jgi:ketosteroid isomerase-like protein
MRHSTIFKTFAARCDPRPAGDRENRWACALIGITVPTMNVDAVAFSERWARNWNAHDVEAVLEDFHDDVVFTSPVAAKLLPATNGVLRGKAALRRYWTAALERIPDLRFCIEGVFQGINTVVITYRNQNDDLVNEVLTFKDNLIVEGHGTYRVTD